MGDVPGHRLEGQGWLGQPGEPVCSGLQAALPGPSRQFLSCVFPHTHPSNLLGFCLFLFFSAGKALPLQGSSRPQRSWF